MPIASLVLATIAALLHVFFWLLESVRFRQPATWKRFGVKSQEEADIVAPMALNQGFYNLFLAIGALVGVGFSIAARSNDEFTLGPNFTTTQATDSLRALAGGLRDYHAGNALIVFTMLCMLGAALVLVISNRKLARAAAIQGGPPALALLIAAIF